MLKKDATTHADRNGARVSPLTGLGLVAAVGLYLWAACGIITVSLHQINPDGVAYMRLARYYAEGRLDLAVSSYWGPLLSWLLVPATWLGCQPHLAFKLYQAAFGLGLGGATAFLARRLGYRHTIVLPVAAGLGLALAMLFEPVTPDLLLALLLTGCLACGAGLLDRPTARGAAATGALAGACYLAKAYALPFFVVMLAVTGVMRRLARRGSGAKHLLLAAAVFAAVAGPWIAVISFREGKFTFSTVTDTARAWSPGIADESRPLYRLQKPRAGRITSWENPVEITETWPLWSPLDGLDGLKQQATVAAAGWADTLWALVGADRFALLPAGLLLAVVLLVRQRGAGRPAASTRAWACVMIFVYVAGYTLVLVQERYLWPLQGAIAALALWAVWDYWPRRGAALRRRSRIARTLVPAFSILLLVSIGWKVAATRADWREHYGPRTEMQWVRAVRVQGLRPVASDDWFRGLYVSYWSDTSYLGKLAGKTAEDVAAELDRFGRTCVVIWYDDKLADEMDAHPSFEPLSRHPHPGGQDVARLFAFDP